MTPNQYEWQPSVIPGFTVEESPRVAAYVVVFFVPIAGFVMAIRQHTRGNTGPAGAMLLATIAGTAFRLATGLAGA